MGEQTAISWTDHTFNPWVGCTKVSPACDGCYAEAMMGETGRYKRVAWGAPGKGVGTRSRTAPSNWRQPLKWNREAAAEIAAWRSSPIARAETPKPSRFVFCASLADVFDNQVPEEWRRDLFDLIRATPHLTWLLLTKRPQNIVRLWWDISVTAFRAIGENWPAAVPWPCNAAIGCTVVTQEEADRDIPKLLAAKAVLEPAFAFLSMEPLLGPVDLWPMLGPHMHKGEDREGVDWVITGGETDQGKHKARPTHPDWLRSIRDQCAAAGVPYHHKQNGEWGPDPELGRDFLASDVGVPIGSIEHLQSSKGSYAVAWQRLDDDGVHARGIQLKRLGKKRSGRLLDGVLHDAKPVIAA